MIQRIQRQRTRGWRIPAGTLCVSRPSIWGNPWVGPDCVLAYQRFWDEASPNYDAWQNVQERIARGG